MAETNVGEFSDDHNTTVSANQSFQQAHDKYTQSTIVTLHGVIWKLVLALGIPGNVLSAIVWLRHGVTTNNSSAVYLAALAINDLIFLLFAVVQELPMCRYNWLCVCSSFLSLSAGIHESLLVLGFSVERLIAILHPLQVLGPGPSRATAGTGKPLSRHR